MSVAELKQHIQKKIEQETNEDVLNSVLSILEKSDEQAVNNVHEVYEKAKAKFRDTLQKLAQ